MNLRHIGLVLSRELRDQMRDRRTIAAVFVLPLLLYPMLGVSLVQLSQLQQRPEADAVSRGHSTGAAGDAQPPGAANQPPAAAGASPVVASVEGNETAGSLRLWGMLIPLAAVVWALTGAFYPAVDMCAGEKERGTLETLLTSPVGRREIVLGKLGAVVLFSLASSLLNVASLSATGWFLAGQLSAAGAALAAPPPAACLAAMVAAIPAAVLFGSLGLALASLARGSREGHYYLVPLLMGSMPFLLLGAMPSSRLDAGTSLIPLSGLVLLSRSLIEGELLLAATYAVPVLSVTLMCCVLAVRWAVSQFQSEQVLFRGGETGSLLQSIRSALSGERAVPTAAAALACGAAILALRLFAPLLFAPPAGWSDFVRSSLAIQIGLIAAPAALFALLFGGSLRKAFLIRRPPPLAVPMAVMLVFAMHPLGLLLSQAIQSVFPLGNDMQRSLAGMSETLAGAPLWAILFSAAALPALCEEFAFRGFILSGLRGGGSKWGAILLSSVFFALAHMLLQQSLAALVSGLLLGYLAVQSKSLLPCVAYHFTHNALGILAMRLATGSASPGGLDWIYHGIGRPETFGCHWPVAAAGLLYAIIILWWFRRLPEDKAAREMPAAADPTSTDLA